MTWDNSSSLHRLAVRGRTVMFCFAAVALMAHSARGEVRPFTGSYDAAIPVLSVGSPTIVPNDNPATHVDPNAPTSPYAGVVSWVVTGGFGCSGSLISPQHVLTVAHCLDVSGGLTAGSQPTGDGVVDVLPSSITVYFNHNNPTNDLAGSTARGVSQITLHPDWHGFANSLGPEGTSINDDVAIMTLSSPAPAGVPVYPLSSAPFTTVQRLRLAGYGNTGSGDGGYVAAAANHLFVKRTGENLASLFDTDDEAPNTARELFLFDFDGGTAADLFGDGLTLGNTREVTLGVGDSGSPSFLWSDLNSNLAVDVGELTQFGINSFVSGVPNGPAPPLFGSYGGGILVSTYKPFIDTVVPEPGALSLAGCGAAALIALLGRAKRRGRKWLI